MAGHSKWSNIQHRKGAQDAKRSKIFTKHIKAIKSAAKKGDPDPATNPHLRNAIEKAYASNLPKDKIERAIGLSDDDVDYLEVRYEGYGPAGVAVMVDCLTDNKNRTVADVRHSFTKCGGNLGTDGSVAYLFTKAGNISFEKGEDEERIMEIAIEAGADDIETQSDGSIDISTTPEAFNTVKTQLTDAGLTPSYAEITLNATTQVDIDDLETAQKILKLNQLLEDNDDVQQVYINADFSDAVLEQLK